MIVRVIHIYVQEHSVEAFKRATIENHAASLREEGVLRFDVLEDEADPTHFVLYEAYRSIEATELHKQTPHYAKWKTVVEPFMARERERSSYSVVAPRDEGGW